MSDAAAAAQASIYVRAAALADPDLIEWPNDEFTPPNGQVWLAVDILWGDAFEATMEDTGRNTIVGGIQISVFGPKGNGSTDIMTKAGEARALFNRVEFNGVRCGAPSAPKRLDDEEWAAVAVTIPFTVDELT